MNAAQGSPPGRSRKGEPEPGRASWHARHLWEIQPVRDILLLLAVFGIVVLGYKIRVVTVPLLLALVLAYLFEPVIKRVTRLKWMSRQGASILIILAAIVVIVVPATVGTGFAIVQGVSFAESLAGNLAAVRQSVDSPEDEALLGRVPSGAWRSIRDFLVEERAGEHAGQGVLFRQALDAAVNYVRANADSVAKSLGKAIIGTGADAARLAIGTVTSFGVFVFGLFLTGFFFYFVSTGWGRVLEFWESLIPERRKGRVIDLVKKMDAVVSGFVRGRLTVCFCLMVYFTIGYAVIGVPAALILGPIVGALSLVPYISAVGTPIAMLLLWLQPGSGGWMSSWWWIVFAPIGVSLISQVLDDYILTPMIQGKSTNMDMPTILFVSIAGGALAGLYGILLAIPVGACAKILIREVLWPPFRDWAQGKSADPLPLGGGGSGSGSTSAS